MDAAPDSSPSLPAGGLAAVDDVQRRVRDLLLAELPRIGVLRLVLFPTFLLLLGSDAARAQRGDGTNDLLLGVYVVLAIGTLVLEQVRLQETGLTSTRRRLPRDGRRQVGGALGVVAAIVATNLVGGLGELWWVGLPFGLAAAAVSYASRARWAASLPSAPALRLPGPDPQGPFQPAAAARLGAALALADRVRPEVLESRLALPAGALRDGVPALQGAGFVRVMHPDPEGRDVVTFTPAGRRAWRRHAKALAAG